jgi:hypothetical protein
LAPLDSPIKSASDEAGQWEGSVGGEGRGTKKAALRRGGLVAQFGVSLQICTRLIYWGSNLPGQICSRRSKPVVPSPSAPVFPRTFTSVALSVRTRSLLRAAMLQLPFTWPGWKPTGRSTMVQTLGSLCLPLPFPLPGPSSVGFTYSARHRLIRRMAAIRGTANYYRKLLKLSN